MQIWRGYPYRSNVQRGQSRRRCERSGSGRVNCDRQCHAIVGAHDHRRPAARAAVGRHSCHGHGANNSSVLPTSSAVGDTALTGGYGSSASGTATIAIGTGESAVTTGSTRPRLRRGRDRLGIHGDRRCGRFLPGLGLLALQGRSRGGDLPMRATTHEGRRSRTRAVPGQVATAKSSS